MTWEIHDIADKPPPSSGPFWAAIRDMPIEKALFVPHITGGRTLAAMQSRALTIGKDHPRPGLKLRTQQDNQRDGIWVWWEEEKP